MQQYSEGEIRFNLMALIRDRRTVATEQLTALAARAEHLQACIGLSHWLYMCLQSLTVFLVFRLST